MAGDESGGSWGKVIAMTVGACLFVGALLWVIVPKGVPVTEAEPAAVASSAAPAVVPDPDPSRTAKPRRTVVAKPYTGKPQLSIQLSDPAGSACPPTYLETMVVRVLKGEVDEVVAVARITGATTQTRERTLIQADGEFTGQLGGLPSDRPVQLLIIATGPYGKTTIFRDITHDCPGVMSRDDPAYLGSREGRREIREKMFDDNYKFDFKFDYGKSHDSGDSSPAPSAGRD
ncbi:MAG: hypothetical protein U0R64_02175 [Candidatus Nanopelagicales bacterium]